MTSLNTSSSEPRFEDRLLDALLAAQSARLGNEVTRRRRLILRASVATGVAAVVVAGVVMQVLPGTFSAAQNANAANYLKSALPPSLVSCIADPPVTFGCDVTITEARTMLNIAIPNATTVPRAWKLATRTVRNWPKGHLSSSVPTESDFNEAWSPSGRLPTSANPSYLELEVGAQSIGHPGGPTMTLANGVVAYGFVTDGSAHLVWIHAGVHLRVEDIGMSTSALMTFVNTLSFPEGSVRLSSSR